MQVTSKISTKYQVVLPKKVREFYSDLQPGRELIITPINEHEFKISVKPTAEEWLESASGIAKGAWGEDSTGWLRKLRDEWER